MIVARLEAEGARLTRGLARGFELLWQLHVWGTGLGASIMTASGLRGEQSLVDRIGLGRQSSEGYPQFNARSFELLRQLERGGTPA